MDIIFSSGQDSFKILQLKYFPLAQFQWVGETVFEVYALH